MPSDPPWKISSRRVDSPEIRRHLRHGSMCLKSKQPVENSFHTSQVVGDHWISESSAFLTIQTRATADREEQS